MESNQLEKRQGKIIPNAPRAKQEDFKGFVPHPLADINLTSKIYDLLQQALMSKQVKKGINETLKMLGKDTVEVVIMAANADPPELLASLPGVCEEQSIPYCFVPDAAGLGRACGIKRPVICCCVVKTNNVSISGQLEVLKDKIEMLFYS